MEPDTVDLLVEADGFLPQSSVQAILGGFRGAVLSDPLPPVQVT